MIRCEGISFSYTKKAVLKNISFSLEDSQITALLGVNGSGKTTLLRIISRFLKPKHGVVYVNNKPLSDYSELELARALAYMPKNL